MFIFDGHNMNLYIKYVNGSLIDFPVLESNLKMIYPECDFVTTFPPDYIPFIYKDQPEIPWNMELKTRQRVENNQAYNHYELVPKHPDIIEKYLTKFRNEKPFPSWTCDEENLRYVPPKAYPEDGKLYTWDENQLDWSELGPDPNEANPSV